MSGLQRKGGKQECILKTSSSGGEPGREWEVCACLYGCMDLQQKKKEENPSLNF